MALVANTPVGRCNHMRCIAFLIVIGLGFALGCGSSDSEGLSTGSTKTGSRSGEGLDGPITLVTDTEGETARAGLVFKVACRAFKTPIGSDAGATAAVALPGPATITVDLGPGGAGPSSVSGTSVTFWKVGVYRVACHVKPKNGGAVIDAEAAELEVDPGLPTDVDTEVTPTTLKAGATATATCKAQDAYGNPIVDGFKLTVDPPSAAEPMGLSLVAKKAGHANVGCLVDNTPDATPVGIDIVAATPRKIVTTLDPATVQAGLGSKISCTAFDNFDNVVKDFPFALDVAKGLELKGKYLSTTAVGLYPVKCVPESLEWDLFQLEGATLHVVPGPPATILVSKVPDKSVYPREEKVQFVVAIKDAYGNFIQDAKLGPTVIDPATGWSKGSGTTWQFNEDGKYAVTFVSADDPNVKSTVTLTVDGAPPAITIDYPERGATLSGKPSVQVTGTAGDEMSGITKVEVNGKSTFPNAAGKWVAQMAALHGNNPVEAIATDAGDQKARATRAFYYATKYYPDDASNPAAAMVADGFQIFLGKTFIDDGVHDPAHVNDLATLVEIVLGGLDIGSLIPSPASQSGDVTIWVNKVSYGKPKVSMAPVQGGLHIAVHMVDFKAHIKVKYKKKIAFVTVSITVEGEISSSSIDFESTTLLSVKDGKVDVAGADGSVKLGTLNISLDGIAGLFDFVFNILSNLFKGQIESQLNAQIKGQIPKLVGGLFKQFELNQSFDLPSLVPGQKPTTLSLKSAMQTLDFTPKGGRIVMDAAFVASKGVAHNPAGSIGRDGCVGGPQDVFQIDENQSLMIALHDDVLNEALFSAWWSGTLNLTLTAEALKGLAGAGDGLDLTKYGVENLAIKLDPFLPPILESCNTPDPNALRLQIGDMYIEAQMDLFTVPTTIGMFMSFEATAKLETVLKGTGSEIGVSILEVKDPFLEIVSITGDFKDQAPMLEGLFKDQLTKALAGALTGKTLASFPLPALDLGSLSSQLPGGTKLVIDLKSINRDAGYTAVSAGLK